MLSLITDEEKKSDSYKQLYYIFYFLFLCGMSSLIFIFSYIYILYYII